jgi:hypothetical protein
MRLLIDTREQNPLVFSEVKGVSIERAALPTADYGAIHGEGAWDAVLFERKSLGDLFGSFHGKAYRREKAKIQVAQEQGYELILAIEGSLSDVLAGFTYRKGGRICRSRKSGLAMARQLMTIERRYGVRVWFCGTRKEMAWRIIEYYLAGER